MRHNQRNAVTMVVVLLCLTIATMLTMVQVRLLLNVKSSQRQRAYSIQARSLAAAGMDLALAQLERRSTYDGEVWKLPASVLTQSGSGRVSITVSEAEDGRMIAVVAEYPAGSRTGVTARRKKYVRTD